MNGETILYIIPGAFLICSVAAYYCYKHQEKIMIRETCKKYLGNGIKMKCDELIKNKINSNDKSLEKKFE